MRFIFFIFVLFLPFNLSAQNLDYAPASYEKISKLFWRYGYHDVKNDKILDEYMQVTNCSLYKQYYEDDFLWQNIREGMRRKIGYFAGDYSDRFEIHAGLPLGRYDFNESAFIIPQGSRLSNAGAIWIPVYKETKQRCTAGNDIRYFPSSIKFSADNKFRLDKIPVTPEVAREIAERMKKFKYAGNDNDRIAHVRFRIRTTGVKNFISKRNLLSVIFAGQLDEIAVFEDPEMTKLIWMKSFKALY